MASMSHSERLRFAISLTEPRVNAVTHAFWNHPNLKGIFPEYLMTLYASMRTTVPMLNAAAERSRALAGSDPVAAQLVPYFVRHAYEELNHDEWLLEDMEILGIDRSEAMNRVPPPGIAEMIGTQYYWLFHVHPIGVLGSFAVLEGNPPLTETLDALAERAEIPKAALRTLYKHAELDPHHRDELNEAIDELPLGPQHVELLGLSALVTVGQLCDVLQDLITSDVRAGVAAAPVP